MSQQAMDRGGAPSPAMPGSNGGSPDRPDIEQVIEGFLEETLASVLGSAKQSTAELIERARAASAEHVAESERLRGEVQAQMARVATWREQVEPLVRSVYAKGEEIRARIDDVPSRLSDALAPLTGALGEIDRVMSDLTNALRPPDVDRAPTPPDGPNLAAAPIATEPDSDDPPQRGQDESEPFAGSPVDPLEELPVPTSPMDDAAEVAEERAGQADLRPFEPLAPRTKLVEWHASDERAATSSSEVLDEPDEEAEPGDVVARHADGEFGKRPATDIDWSDLPSAQAS